MATAVLLAVAAAGGFGAVSRHVLVEQVRLAAPDAPLAIGVVNVLGCLGFGVVAALASGRWPPVVTAALLSGFFGAFTTFSSFAFDCQQLLAERRYAALLGNVAVQNLLGLAALLGGIGLADWLRD
jgi:CrcB protein